MSPGVAIAAGGNGNGTGRQSHFKAALLRMIPREYKYSKSEHGHGNALDHGITNSSALVNKNNDIPEWWAHMVENRRPLGGQQVFIVIDASKDVGFE